MLHVEEAAFAEASHVQQVRWFEDLQISLEILKLSSK